VLELLQKKENDVVLIILSMAAGLC